VCDGLGSVEEVPSPKSHENILPVEEIFEKFTVREALHENVGPALKSTAGFAMTCTDFITESLQAPKVATILTLKFPAFAKFFIAFIELEEVPSPKFQVTAEGAGLLVFKKFTSFPAHRVAGAEKSAFTFPSVIILGLIIVSEQPFVLNTIRLTE
jgi:hypothetical protein